MDRDQREIARIFDVPPWLIADVKPPRLRRLRWALRRWWPLSDEHTPVSGDQP